MSQRIRLRAKRRRYRRRAKAAHDNRMRNEFVKFLHGTLKGQRYGDMTVFDAWVQGLVRVDDVEVNEGVLTFRLKEVIS